MKGFLGLVGFLFSAADIASVSSPNCARRRSLFTNEILTRRRGWNYFKSIFLRGFIFFSKKKKEKRFVSVRLPSGAHLQTMQPYCGGVRCGAILFSRRAREAGKSPVMVVRGSEVGIKPSLFACSVPLIRRLASAMQWARRKVS